MNLSLIDAFARFGAKPERRLGGLSAMAADGAMVLSCSPTHFGHPARGVLRYETRLSEAQAQPNVVATLSGHLTRARDGALPVRMIVTFAESQRTRKGGGYYIRPDLIGKVVEFDGDRFVIDFRRPEAPRVALAARPRN